MEMFNILCLYFFKSILFRNDTNISPLQVVRTKRTISVFVFQKKFTVGLIVRFTRE